MKKLIAMIGAFATAFGLYAEGEPGVSFEADDAGVNAMTFTVSAQETPRWTAWEGGEVFNLSLWGSEVKPYDTDYPRRDDNLFPAGSDNVNYLKLATGTEKLTYANDDAANNIFLDQLVKFTGFDEEPTLPDDAKIAVWMSEYENPNESTVTNLFVSCGKYYDGAASKVTLQINGEYKLDTWYRLTIRSLGNIYKDGYTDDTRAGFIIYINGQQVAAVTGQTADDLIEAAESMTTTAKGYMAKGMLFPAFDTTDVAFNEVAYRGIGAIDDVLFDANGPEFAQKVPFTVLTADDKLEVVSIKDADGNDVDPAEGVPANTAVTVTYKAADGYKILGDKASVTKTIVSADDSEIDPSEEINVQAVVATVTNGSKTDGYAASELYNMLANVVEDDVVTFLAAATIKDGEENPKYTVASNTTITVGADAAFWSIYVGNTDENEANDFTDYVGAPAGYSKTFEFEDAEGYLVLNGDVAGSIEVTVGSVDVADDIEVSGLLKVATDEGTFSISESITISGSGKVVTQNGTFTEEIVGADGADIEKLLDMPEADWFTYQIKQAPDMFDVEFVNGQNSTITPLAGVSNFVVGTTLTITATAAEDFEFAESSYEGWEKVDRTTLKIEDYEVTNDDTITAPDATAIRYVASVTSGSDTFKFETAAEALAKVLELEKDSANFPIVAKALVDRLEVVGPNGQQIVLVKDETITINANSWVFSSGVTISQGPIALAAGATFTVVGQIANYKNLFSVPADYKVKEINNGDGTYTYTTEAKVYVAQIGDNKFETLAEAVAADGDVTLLADITLTETLAIAKAKAINLAGKTITFGNGLQKGITTEPNGIAGDLVISNGNFAVAGTRPAKGYAFVLYRVNALIKDVTMDLEGFEYGLEAETMLGKPTYWTDVLQYAIVCENVDVSGNGSLFHFENVEATLDADCSATKKGTPFGAAHDSAIYSSCGAVVTVAGGTYEQVNALQTGDLGGTLIVNGGDFTGDIKSYMGQRVERGVEEWEQNVGKITITAGEFDGDFVEVKSGSDKMIWEVKGGSFTADPTAYLADGYAAIKSGYVWNVGEAIIATFKVDEEIVKAETNIVAFTPTAPADPVKEGYNFTGWNPTISVIDKDTTYTAQFAIKTFTVTFYNDTEVFATSNNIAWGTTTAAPVPDPEKDNAEFKFWATIVENVTNEFDFATQIKDNYDLYAIFEAKESGVVPEQPQPIDAADLDEAKEKAAKMPVQLSAAAAEAAGDGAATLTAMLYVSAEQVGPSSFQTKVDFRPEAVAAVTETATAVEAALATQNADLAAEEVTVTVTEGVIPGLYYGIVAVDDLGAISTTEPEDWQLATKAGVTLTAEKPSPTKGFYRVKCAPDHPGQLK